MTVVTFEPIRLFMREDDEGRLVFVDGTLAGVLACLSDLHGAQAGSWFLEAGFGTLDGVEHPVFSDLQAAEAWIVERLGGERGVSLPR